VHLLLQYFRQGVKTELTCTLNQNYFVFKAKFPTLNGTYQGRCIRIKGLLYIKACSAGRYFISYTYDAFNVLQSEKSFAGQSVHSYGRFKF
jgi:hypothetical protein